MIVVRVFARSGHYTVVLHEFNKDGAFYHYAMTNPVVGMEESFQVSLGRFSCTGNVS